MRLCQPRSDALRLRPGKKNGRDSAQGASAFGDIWNSCGLRRPVVLTNADAHRNGQCDAHADATCYRREAHLPAVGAAAQIGPPRGESQLGLAGVDCLIHSTAPMVFPRAPGRRPGQPVRLPGVRSHNTRFVCYNGRIRLRMTSPRRVPPRSSGGCHKDDVGTIWLGSGPDSSDHPVAGRLSGQRRHAHAHHRNTLLPGRPAAGPACRWHARDLAARCGQLCPGLVTGWPAGLHLDR